MNKWLELVEEAHAAEADAEADDLRSQVLRAKQERAARVMQQCLNRICNSKYAYAWYQWRAVIASMLKAAQTMQRCLNMISNLKFVQSWDHWLGVMEAEKHAGQVMLRCLNRICNAYEAGGFGQWVAVVDVAVRSEAGRVLQLERISRLDARLGRAGASSLRGV